MKKKMISVVVCSVAAAAILAGCGSSSGSSSSLASQSEAADGDTADENSAEADDTASNGTGNGTVINFYYWDDAQTSGVNALIDGFEKTQDTIKVQATLVPWNEYWTKLQTALPTGTGPDVFWMNLYSKQYIDAGLLMDLTDKISEDGMDMDKYPASVTAYYTDNGKYYGIPKDYDGTAIFYNKAIFDEMGVAYPKADWTWEEFRETAKALTNSDHYGFVCNPDGNSGYQNFIYQNGGKLVDDEGNPTVNTKEVVGALQFEHDLMYEDHISPTGTEQLEMGYSDMFVGGKTAMVSDGSWDLGKYVEALGDNCQIAELPTGVRKGATTHGLAYCIAENSSNKEAAWEFVRYAGSEEGESLTASGAIPAYEGCDKAWLDLYPNQDVQILLDSVTYASPNPMYKSNMTEVGQVLTDTIANIWQTEDIDIQSEMENCEQSMIETMNQ